MLLCTISEEFTVSHILTSAERSWGAVVQRQGHLEAPRHEDCHDGQAAQAHPEGPGVQLPGRALVGRARCGQIGQRGISSARVTHRCGVGDVVGVDLRVNRAPACTQTPASHRLHVILRRPAHVTVVQRNCNLKWDKSPVDGGAMAKAL